MGSRTGAWPLAARPVRPPHSPERNTPHKTGNGVDSITCRNRHCPKCQANARDRWLEARSRELLPTRYVHVVFTLPRELAPLALQNKREIYSLLFRASAETLLTVARDPQHLGAEIGFFSVLHTWNQKLLQNPHS
jgi:Transposase zinc-binding domain